MNIKLLYLLILSCEASASERPNRVLRRHSVQWFDSEILPEITSPKQEAASVSETTSVAQEEPEVLQEPCYQKRLKKPLRISLPRISAVNFQPVESTDRLVLDSSNIDDDFFFLELPDDQDTTEEMFREPIFTETSKNKPLSKRLPRAIRLPALFE